MKGGLKMYKLDKPTDCALYDIYGRANKIDNIKEICLSIEPYPCVSEEDEIIDRICSIGCTSFQFTIEDIKYGFLTKRQNHLSKYGKYRVRKKYNNMVWRKFLRKKRRN